MTVQTPFEILDSESEMINPAIILAEELMRRNVAELLSSEEIKNAENVLEHGTEEIKTIDLHKAAFLKCTPTAAACTPLGF
ncbi:MAG: hypothetical protein WBO10_12550 [Pyrinomonadaceae bacterium]